MSDLWLQFSDDFEMCQRCVGTGSVHGGYGGAEYVMCSSCGGRGSIQKYGRKRTRRKVTAAAETDEPGAEEKSEGELWREMLDQRLEIEGYIAECKRYGLSRELVAQWSGRLEKIDATSPEAEAELTDLAADVWRFRGAWVSAIGKNMDEKDKQLVNDLSLIGGLLELLAKQSAQYQKRFPRLAAGFGREDEERTLREEIEALAAASGPESVVACPGCNAKMKARNLRLHFDKKHWWKEDGTA